MKVFIVSDLEGVSGVTKGGQTTGGAPMYEESRRLYTEEINAVRARTPVSIRRSKAPQ